MKPLLVVCTLIVCTTTAIADIARPKPPAEKPAKIVLHTGLEIVPDAKAYEARLQITQSDLQNLRAAIEGAPTNRSFAATIAQSPTRTIIAGLLLFLSVSFAGVWLSRSRLKGGRGQKAVVAGVLVLATLSAAAIITRGNAGPPGYYRWRNLPESLSQGRPTSGGLDIEIVPDDPNSRSGMRLIIPLRKAGGSGDE